MHPEDSEVPFFEQSSYQTIHSRYRFAPTDSAQHGNMSPGDVIAGSVSALPADCFAVRIQIVFSAAPGSSGEVVFRGYLGHGADETATPPVRSVLSGGRVQTITLDPYFFSIPGGELEFRIERVREDPAATAFSPITLEALHVIPVQAPAAPVTVDGSAGYSTWPMIQSVNGRLICIYSRGTGHDIGEAVRAVYARGSADGIHWDKEEFPVLNTAGCGDVPVGKGIDENGELLVWIRSYGKELHHTLFRSGDGRSFTPVCRPEFDPMPMQMTDIVHVPTVGLMCLWFAGTYQEEHNSWGTMVSCDNGATWEQRIVEAELHIADWPTEPSAVYFGEGRILAVGRTESRRSSTECAQFQLESSDYGRTWTKHRTNITDVATSTPSLILDPETGILSNYYFHRLRGILKCRRVKAVKIWGRPLDWPEPEILGFGSPIDAGNVNAVRMGKRHFVAWYSRRSSGISGILATGCPIPEKDSVM